MTRRFFPKASLMAATALCGLGLAPHGALADPTSSQIGSIEKQIRALEGQLNHMKRDMSSRNAEVKAARAEAATASRQARETEERLGPVRYDVNGRPMAPMPLSAPPGYGYAGGSPYMNVNGYPSYVPSGPKLKQGQFAVGGVRVTLGGFIEAAGIYRSRNEDADISSSFNTGIPLPQSPNYHQGEFRGTARQSRFSILAEGAPDANTLLTAYYETDFNSAGVTSNSNESNSYTLRTRQLFAQYKRTDDDFFVLGGQTWSLATMTKKGEDPRTEDLPAVIDAQYVPGFVWTRNVGLRIVKGFDHDKYDLGLSFESPESSYSQAATSLGGAYTVTSSSPGLNGNGSTLNNTANYSNEAVPDIIAKATTDQKFGHFELFGIARFLHDRVSVVGSGSNHTVLAGGGGIGMTVPLIPKKLEFRLSGLAGEGLGRYGSGQFADATIARDGSPKPLPEVLGLVGLLWHPVKSIDLYGLIGTEQITHREAYTSGGKGYGYGSPLYSNAGCEVELSAATCTANSSGIVQGTAGFWWKFLKGDYGTMQTGLQYSYTRRSIFSGESANTRVQVSPHTDDNIVMASFRYYPFQ